MKGFVRNKKIIFYFTLLGVLCVSSTALALQNNWPNSPAGTALNDESTLPILIQYLYEWGISLGGLAVFIVLLIAGVEYMASFGNPTAMKSAMDRIQSAFIGLVLLLSSWLILNTINPDLTTFRPLVIEPPKEAFGACKGDSDCKEFGIDYECTTEGYCAQNLEKQLTMTPCDSVTIYDKNEKLQGTVQNNSYAESVNIAIGDPFSFTTNPVGCMGYLELYPRMSGGSSCGGDKQQIILGGNKNKDKAGDAVIKCVELKEIEGQ